MGPWPEDDGTEVDPNLAKNWPAIMAQMWKNDVGAGKRSKPLYTAPARVPTLKLGRVIDNMLRTFGPGYRLADLVLTPEMLAELVDSLLSNTVLTTSATYVVGCLGRRGLVHTRMVATVAHSTRLQGHMRRNYTI